MSEHTSPTDRSIFTIGHSNHSLETFLWLLKAQHIEALVDTRSQPYSRYTPHFNLRDLQAALTQSGISYLFMGKELGGRPECEGFYDEAGRVDYARVAVSPLFLEGIARVEKGIQTYRVALLCSEENPEGCHRRLLVGRVLAGRGVSVGHIRSDGSVQPEEETQTQDQQMSLFGTQETPEWKSIQSVLRREKRPNSLEH